MVQLDSVSPQAGTALDAKSSSVIDVIELMAAVLEDSPSNRLTMLQTSGNTSTDHMFDHLHNCWVYVLLMVWTAEGIHIALLNEANVFALHAGAPYEYSCMSAALNV